MSGVHIKGMEMPKEYAVVVKIFPDGRVGAVPYIQWFKVDLIEEAQAIPVPDHGRLIDADALTKQIKHDGIRSEPFVKIVCNYFKDAPTIIPASKESV